jgi:aerobic-type carbon monoxide dehydrogenase small subunit (CoxS/CutS family)
MPENIHFKLNGEDISLTVEPSRKLLWVLRADLKLTGSKYGCGKGQCGSCTVVVGNKAVRSCLVTMRSVKGKEVLTIEGLSRNGDLHPLQRAFAEHDALQCGYCTPGMIMNAYALLQRNPKPSRSQIISGMEGNLCRCSSYLRIVWAIQAAAKEIRRA